VVTPAGAELGYATSGGAGSFDRRAAAAIAAVPSSAYTPRGRNLSSGSTDRKKRLAGRNISGGEVSIGSSPRRPTQHSDCRGPSVEPQLSSVRMRKMTPWVPVNQSGADVRRSLSRPWRGCEHQFSGGGGQPMVTAASAEHSVWTRRSLPCRHRTVGEHGHLPECASGVDLQLIADVDDFAAAGSARRIGREKRRLKKLVQAAGQRIAGWPRTTSGNLRPRTTRGTVRDTVSGPTMWDAMQTTC